MWGRVTWAYLALSGLAPATSRAAEPTCRDVQRTIDQLVADAADPAEALRLAPFTTQAAVTAMLRAAEGSSSAADAAFDRFLALGLTRQAEALRLLRRASPPSPATRMGRALGLLALGDGAETATIARVLYEGSAEDRRRTARALAAMRQKRPELLLYDALEDADPIVRLEAARALAESGAVRARRVLVDVLRSKDPALAPRAARALARQGYDFRPDELPLLSPELRLDVVAADAHRARRAAPAMLAAQTRSPDDTARAAAFAAIATTGLEGNTPLKKQLPKAPELPSAELATALALAGDAAVIPRLVELDKADAERAIRIVFAFARISEEHDDELPARVARIVEAWLARGALDEPHTAMALRAVERLDPALALGVARKRLAGAPDGPSFARAIRVAGRHGTTDDLATLKTLHPKLKGKARAALWRAAARICARG
ncbi:HEAT repeat domain-containing protein [Myxococcota bacterium]|nr:HEAT repeat domain-containing protein [Myxococcota bacterium]